MAWVPFEGVPAVAGKQRSKFFRVWCAIVDFHHRHQRGQRGESWAEWSKDGRR